MANSVSSPESSQNQTKVTDKEMQGVQILVVDDEQTLTEVLRYNLEAEGYKVTTASSAEEALTLDLERFDLMLLDIMMGGMSGLELAERLKQNPATAEIPVIFCTARDTDDDMVVGLELGADDYIVKPYSLRNVLARVRNVLRRTSSTRADNDSKNQVLTYKGLEIDIEKKRCTVHGEEIKVPRKELEILIALLSSRGRIFSRDELLQHVWPDDVTVLPRVVDVNITRLRSKLGEYGSHIVTRSGYGYGFVE